MPTMNVSCYCQPMRIVRVKRRLRRADDEPVIVTVTREDGTQQVISAGIPETLVDQVDAFGLRWRVRPCSVKGGAPLRVFRMDLPAEDVFVRYDVEEHELAAFAQPIDCPTTFVDEHGVVWKGLVRFGECEADIVSLTTNVAEAITAEGVLERQP